MKLEKLDREITSAGSIGKVVRATVHASRKVFDMFSDNTYANIEEAIARELVANAVDAQRLNGKADVPVTLILPTELEPIFTVIDVGPGMSQEFVEGPFMAFTNGSTKDGNDDDIGGFGIGSKSPLGYVDQFTLRVVHDGILSIYTLFRDEEGIPSIVLQAQTTTDEATGVQVSFPVEIDDIPKFQEAAQTALQYFHPLPNVVNGVVVAADYQYVGDTWAMRRTEGPLGIIMGGVRYPVVSASLSAAVRSDTRIAGIINYGLDLTLPIGSVAIAMSREQLQYTQKTNDAIQQALVSLQDEVAATFATAFDNEPSLWEASRALALQTAGTGSRAQLLLGRAQYRGEKLDKSIDIRSKIGGWFDDKVWQVESLLGKRRSTIGSSRWETFSYKTFLRPGEISRVIIDDLPQKPSSKSLARIRIEIEDNVIAGDTLAIRPDDRSIDVARILERIGNPVSYVLTSSLPVPPAKARTKKTTVRPRVRMFAFDGTQQSTGYSHSRVVNLQLSDNKPGVAEIPYATQPASGILVTMDRFNLPSPDKFYKNMASGLIRYDEIYFVNAGDAVKIKDNFVDFFEEHDRRLKVALAKHKDLPARIALSNNSRLSPLFDIYKALPEHLTPAQQRRPFGKIAALYDKYVATLTYDEKKLAPFITPAYPKGVDPVALVNMFKTEQPDAALLLNIIEDDDQAHLRLLMKNL